MIDYQRMRKGKVKRFAATIEASYGCFMDVTKKRLVFDCQRYKDAVRESEKE